MTAPGPTSSIRLSAGDYFDGDGRGLSQHVVDGRPAARLLDDAAQGRVVRISLDVEGHLDLLVAVADAAIGQPEDAEKVDVALDGRVDLGELDAPGGCDVRDARRQARGDRVEQVLHRRRCLVLPDQDGRVVGVHLGDVLVLQLLHRAVEPGERGSAVSAVEPAVGGTELELGDLGLGLDRIQGREQGRGVDHVGAGALGGGGHACVLSEDVPGLPASCWRSFGPLLAAARNGSRHTTAVPSRTVVPTWLVTWVANVVIGLSVRTAETVACAVITSPGRTGARNRHPTSRKTLPGPGSCSATNALRSPDVTPPCTTTPPNLLAAARSRS